MDLNTLLVPVDFSPVSQGAFEQALRLAEGEDAVVIALHVLDPSLADFVASLGGKSRAEALQTMRDYAQGQMAAFKAPDDSTPEVQGIISEGVPFIEILRKADDFQVDAIVMGKFGNRGPVEKLLFGTTAERVIRGTTRPVLVLPIELAERG